MISLSVDAGWGIMNGDWDKGHVPDGVVASFMVEITFMDLAKTFNQTSMIVRTSQLVNKFSMIVRTSRFVSPLSQVKSPGKVRFGIGGTLERQRVRRQSDADVEESEEAHKEQEESEFGRHRDGLMLELRKTERLSRYDEKRRSMEEEEQRAGGRELL